jgi:aspartate oxidase
MWHNAGIIRNNKDLTAAMRQLREWDRMMKNHAPNRELFELRNLITTAQLVTQSALLREGSVGAHYRSDFPKKGRNWRKRTVLRKQ